MRRSFIPTDKTDSQWYVFLPKYRDFGFMNFLSGSIYNVYVTFEVFERESGNIVSYAIESCFDKD